VRRLGLLLALGLGVSLPAVAAEPTVTAQASKTDVSVGERFTVELKLAGPEGTTWNVPEAPGDDKVDLSPAPPPETPLPPDVRRYQAAVYATGEVAVPAIVVGYRLPDGTEGEARSEPIPLRVLSVLPKDKQEQKLVDIRAPRGMSIGRAFWAVCGALLLLVGGLAYWLIRRLRKTHAPLPVTRPAVPPDVEAQRRLSELEASGLLARGELRAFYIELTQIAKAYLERRLSAPVLEMTSAETVAFLRGHRTAGWLAGPVRELAGAADEIKFARGAGLTQQAERHLQAVREWIPKLEEQLRPAPAAGGEAA
jgi:hypothetical protein